MTNAALLLRVSTEEQAADDRHSIPMQRRRVLALVEREGWNLVREFAIEGESAFVDEIERRPDFLAAIEAAERREFDVLIVYDFSRFARSHRVAHEVLYRLRRAGVRLMGADGTDYTEDEDRAAFEAMFARRSSRDHQRRVRDAIDRRHELGLPTGDIPFGYRRRTKRDDFGNVVTDTLAPPEVVPDEAAAIRMAYRAYADGKGQLEIARDLNAMGMRPRSKPRHGRAPHAEFTATGVQRILENPFYLGYVSHHGSTKLGGHDPILTQSEWDAAQARKRRGVRSPRVERMLTGLVYCAACDRPIWCERAGNAQYYYRERKRGTSIECIAAVGRGWRADEPESVVGRIMAGMTWEPEWLRFCDHYERRAVPSAGRARVALEEERRRAAFAHMQGALTDAELSQVMASIRDRRAALPPDIDRAVHAAKRLGSVAEGWEELDDAGRRRVVREALAAVELDLVTRRLRVAPQPEYEELFGLRREFVVDLVRPGGAERMAPTSGLYLPEQLIVEAA